ncbi:GrpB family protein [Spirochaeta dissipatitropha]
MHWKLTVKELSFATGLQSTNITKFECESRPISINTARRLAPVFSCDYQNFLPRPVSEFEAYPNFASGITFTNPQQRQAYSPEYPLIFEAARKSLLKVPGIPPHQIHHIGTTAVRGVTGRPIIDILLCASTDPAELESILKEIGFKATDEPHEPHKPHDHNLRLFHGFFRYWSHEKTPVQLLLAPEGSRAAEDCLLKQDNLRNNPFNRLKKSRRQRTAAAS